MAKCLRCGATEEWIEGRVKPEPATRVAKLEKENRDLRARCEQFRWHLQWIFNPAGNDICTPKEIAEMGLKRTRLEFFKRTQQPPTPLSKQEP